MAASLLFDRSSAQDVELEAGLDRLGKDNLLWIDLERDENGELDRAVEMLEIGEVPAARLREDVRRASITSNGSPLQLTVLAPDGADDLVQIDCVVGDLWLLTVHSCPVESMEEFRGRVTGRGELGEL